MTKNSAEHHAGGAPCHPAETPGFHLSDDALAEALATTDLAARLARVYKETRRRAQEARRDGYGIPGNGQESL